MFSVHSQIHSQGWFPPPSPWTKGPLSSSGFSPHPTSCHRLQLVLIVAELPTDMHCSIANKWWNTYMKTVRKSFRKDQYDLQNTDTFDFSFREKSKHVPRGGLAIWRFWRSPERPSIQRPSAWLVHHQRKSVRLSVAECLFTLTLPTNV